MILYHSSFVVVAQPDCCTPDRMLILEKALSYLLFEGSEKL